MNKILDYFRNWKTNALMNDENHPLPEEISKLIIKNCIFAIVFLLILIATSIVEKDIKYLIALIIPVAFVIRGLNYRYMWNTSRINEIVIQCTSVTKTSRGVRIIGRNTDNKYFEYYTSANNIGDFVKDYTYICYSLISTPHTLIAYRPI